MILLLQLLVLRTELFSTCYPAIHEGKKRGKSSLFTLRLTEIRPQVFKGMSGILIIEGLQELLWNTTTPQVPVRIWPPIFTFSWPIRDSITGRFVFCCCLFSLFCCGGKMSSALPA